MALALLVNASRAPADDWPRWRGPHGDGICRETGLLEAWPDALNPRWTVDVGKGYSGPVVAGGRVYQFSLIDGRDTLACYDAESGDVIWTESYDGGWQGGYPGTRATPYVEGDRIYTYGGAGDLAARDLRSGKEIWRTNIVRESGSRTLGFAQASNPLIDGQLIYVQGGAGGPIVIGIDKADGRLVWRSQARGNGGYSHPIIVDVAKKRQLIVYAADGPFGIDPVSGRTIWHHSWRNGSEVSASDPIYRDGHLFITCAYGMGSIMLKLNPKGAQKAWEKKDLEVRFQPAILDGDHLYVNAEGTLTCIEWPHRSVKWTTDDKEKNLLGMGGSMIRFGNDKMILLGQSGRLTLARVTPAGFTRISSVPDVVDGSEVWAQPAIANGKLFLKGEKELVCVDLRPDP